MRDRISQTDKKQASLEKPRYGIEKYDSTEEMKDIAQNKVIVSKRGDNFQTISGGINSGKNSVDHEKANAKIMYQLLENRINELEKEMSLSNYY